MNDFKYTAEMALFEIWGALQSADDVYSLKRAKTVAKNAIMRLQQNSEGKNSVQHV